MQLFFFCLHVLNLQEMASSILNDSDRRKVNFRFVLILIQRKYLKFSLSWRVKGCRSVSCLQLQPSILSIRLFDKFGVSKLSRSAHYILILLAIEIKLLSSTHSPHVSNPRSSLLWNNRTIPCLLVVHVAMVHSAIFGPAESLCFRGWRLLD